MYCERKKGISTGARWLLSAHKTTSEEDNQILDGKKVPGDPWCSTKVKGSDRQHVSGGGYYGDCNSSCPNAIVDARNAR